MKSLPSKGVRFSMKAHADQCGSDAYNMRLSNKRAHSVYNVMKKHYRITRQIYLDTKEEESSGHHTHDRHVTLTAEFKTALQPILSIFSLLMVHTHLQKLGVSLA